MTVPIPDSRTNEASIAVAGTGEPGMTVTIMNNNVNVGVTTAASDGSYAVEAPLVEGDNALVAYEVNSCDTIKSSSPVTVYRTVITQPQIQIDSSLSQQEAVHVEVVTPISRLLRLPANPIVPVPDSPGYQKPVIISPAAEEKVAGSHIWIVGKVKAQVASTVTIYVNDIAVARATALEDGVYRASVNLQPGRNTLQVRAELNGQVATSELIGVTFVREMTAIPAPSFTLDDVMFKVLPILLGSIGSGGIMFWAIHHIRVRLKRGGGHV